MTTIHAQSSYLLFYRGEIWEIRGPHITRLHSDSWLISDKAGLKGRLVSASKPVRFLYAHEALPDLANKHVGCPREKGQDAEHSPTVTSIQLHHPEKTKFKCQTSNKTFKFVLYNICNILKGIWYLLNYNLPAQHVHFTRKPYCFHQFGIQLIKKQNSSKRSSLKALKSGPENDPPHATF